LLLICDGAGKEGRTGMVNIMLPSVRLWTDATENDYDDQGSTVIASTECRYASGSMGQDGPRRAVR
jgi:hypothetical protein